MKLVLECPDFLLHSASMATVHVSPMADSDWVLFELEALHEGVSTLEILAFNGGAFLGTLSLQLTVDNLAVSASSVDCATLLPLRSPQEGEVTLVIRYDFHSTVYRYQFRSTTFGETDELRSGPFRHSLEKAFKEKQEMQVRLVRSEEILENVSRNSFIQFFVSLIAAVLLGFGVNIITTTPNDWIGWVLIVTSIVLSVVAFTSIRRRK